MRRSLLAAALLALLPAVTAEAKRDRDRAEVRGLVSSRPEGAAGVWVVGGRSFVADARTELDTREGPLVVGACAKVRYVRAGDRDVALEIDSEPASDCGGASQSR
jgi:hypothetical protein